MVVSQLFLLWIVGFAIVILIAVVLLIIGFRFTRGQKEENETKPEA